MTSLRSTAVLIAVTAMSLGSAAFNASVDVSDPMHSLLDAGAIAALGSLPIDALVQPASAEQSLTPTR